MIDNETVRLQRQKRRRKLTGGGRELCFYLMLVVLGFPLAIGLFAVGARASAEFWGASAGLGGVIFGSGGLLGLGCLGGMFQDFVFGPGVDEDYTPDHISSGFALPWLRKKGGDR